MSGQGTTNIDVDFTGASSGTMTLVGLDDCGTAGLPISWPISVSPLPSQAIINSPGVDTTRLCDETSFVLVGNVPGTGETGSWRPLFWRRHLFVTFIAYILNGWITSLHVVAPQFSK